MVDPALRHAARTLRVLVEAPAAHIYFAPEARERYEALGLEGRSGYFCSRGGCLGLVPGEVVCAVFGVFSPAAVVPAVRAGWAVTTPGAVLAARLEAAELALGRMLGGEPAGLDRATELLRRAGEAAPLAGAPLHAGLRSLGWPGTPLGDFWRAADLVREHRGDTHNAAWTTHGVDATEITLLTEGWWRLAQRSYLPTRGWSDAEMDAAVERLRQRRLIDDGGLTDTGTELRAAIEDATDLAERPLVDALGEDAEELFDLLRPWSRAIVEAGGYPRDPALLNRM